MESPGPTSSQPDRPGPLTAILLKRCPRCRVGQIYQSAFRLNKACPHCGYDFYPEPGFYLGAMMVPYFFTAILTIPFAVYLKTSGMEVSELIPRLAVFYFIVSSAQNYFAKTVWLQLEYRLSNRLRKMDERR